MQTKFLTALLLLVFTIGIFGAGSLVYTEIVQQNACPKLLRIPACYIILTCFVIPLFGYFLKWHNIIYFAFTGLAFVIALTASVMQIIGYGECPKTNNGIPMCYYSLVLFTILITLKWLLIKQASKKFVK